MDGDLMSLMSVIYGLLHSYFTLHD